MKTLFSILFLLSLSIKTVFAVSITAEVDINPVFLSDSFHLTYTASGKVDGQPDFDPIKKYFEILGTQKSSSIKMINGDVEQSTSWVLTLIAKSTGTFTIPPIYFAANHAPEVKVIVKDAPVFNNSATPAQDFFIELKSSTQSAYTQQQIIITARLFVSKNINSYQFGELTADNPDTQIITLTKDRQYKTYKGNKQFIVVEKKFAIFPSEPGKLKINPLLAELSIQSRPSRRQFFDPFNTSSITKRFVSKALTFNIKAIPDSYKSDNWLPATNVKLSEEWPNNKKFIAGEPVTRTITLTAEGVTSALLAEIKPQQINGVKQYPDKPITEEYKSESGIKSSLKQKTAYIPTHAGNYTLPAITVSWWNVDKNKIETARIAERKFTVYPSNQKNLNQTPVTKQATPVPAQNTVSSDINKDYSNKLKQTTTNSSSTWFWLSILFFVLWLLTLILWWKSKIAKTPAKEKQKQLSHSVTNSLKDIQAACQNNDAQGTKTALLNWARLIFPELQINNLSALATQVDTALSQRIERLNTHLYSATNSGWECDEIYDLCKKYKPSQTKKMKKNNSAELEAFNRS